MSNCNEGHSGVGDNKSVGEDKISKGINLLEEALAVFDQLQLHGAAAKTSEALDEANAAAEKLQSEANSSAA